MLRGQGCGRGRGLRTVAQGSVLVPAEHVRVCVGVCVCVVCRYGCVCGCLCVGVCVCVCVCVGVCGGRGEDAYTIILVYQKTNCGKYTSMYYSKPSEYTYYVRTSMTDSLRLEMQ